MILRLIFHQIMFFWADTYEELRNKYFNNINASCKIGLVYI